MFHSRPAALLLFCCLASAVIAGEPAPSLPVPLPDSGWGAIEEHAEDLFDYLDSRHAARAVQDAQRVRTLIAALLSRHPDSRSRLAPLSDDGERLAGATQAGNWPAARGFANDITKHALEFRADCDERTRAVARLDWLGREFLRLHEDRPAGFDALLRERRALLRSEWARLRLAYCTRAKNAELCRRMDALTGILDAEGTSPRQTAASRDLLERVDDLEKAPHD